MKNRINSQYVPRMKVLLFADLCTFVLSSLRPFRHNIFTIQYNTLQYNTIQYKFFIGMKHITTLFDKYIHFKRVRTYFNIYMIVIKTQQHMMLNARKGPYAIYEHAGPNQPAHSRRPTRALVVRLHNP